MKAESNSPYQAAVIIPTRGGAAKLHYPLDALEQQTEKDFQVIVVCDGDIDGSEEVVDSYRKRGILNIEAIVFPENRGRVAALNAGHRAAHAHVLIRCDDDLQPERDFIEQHCKHHWGKKEAGVIGIYNNKFPETPYARAYGIDRDRKFREDAYSAPESLVWRYWAGNTSMSSKMFNRLGGYDERFRLYGWEDVDMGYRLYCAGADIKIEPQLLINHYVAATTSASRATRALYSGAARATFVEKHGSHVLAETRPSGIWGFLVRSNSRVTNEKTIHLAGKLIDSVADRLPKNIAEKLIALLVESAGYAGIKYPHRAQKVF